MYISAERNKEKERGEKMKKKGIAILLSLSLISSLLVGCGSASSSANTSSTSNETDGSDASSGTTVTSGSGDTQLTALFVAHPLTEDLSKMQWLQEIADEAGVSVKWEVIYSDWDTTKAARFASGDIPDLLFNATIDSDYTTYDGLFEDMTDLIEEDAPNIQEMFEEEPDTKTLATTEDGKIYGIPKFQGKWPETNTVMFINKTWLDNLGLSMPTTFSELETVLEAFKDDDPNGNGVADEIPLDFNAYGTGMWFSSAYSLTNLMGAFGIQLTDWGTDGYYADETGTIQNYAIDDRYKLFMEYCQDLYAKGLINPDAITNDYSTYQSLSRGDEDGNALVGVCFGWEETDKFGTDLASQYEAVPALDYDIGCDAGTYDTRWRDDYSGLNMSSNRVAMSANCENKDAAMKFIDTFYEQTNSVETLFGGIADGCVSQDDENTYTVLDPTDPDIDSGTWKWTNAFADNGPMYIRTDITLNMTQDMTNAANERTVYADTLAKATTLDSYHQMFMKYSADDTSELAVLQANITNITDNYWSLWMTGQSDIESDWDSYVQSVKDAGLDEDLQIRQEAYDNYLAEQ